MKYLHVTPYISGFLYWKFRDRSVIFLNYFAILLKYKNLGYRLNFPKNTDCYSGISLDSCIEYESKKLCVNSSKLKKIAVYYIAYLEKIIFTYKPSVVIISGEDRLASCVLKNLCKKHNIKTLFFEQGPFSTTILDDNGVNANFSARYRCLDKSSSLSDQQIRIFVRNFLSRKCKKNIHRNIFYRSIDKFFTLKLFTLYFQLILLNLAF